MRSKAIRWHWWRSPKKSTEASLASCVKRNKKKRPVKSVPCSPGTLLSHVCPGSWKSELERNFKIFAGKFRPTEIIDKNSPNYLTRNLPDSDRDGGGFCAQTFSQTACQSSSSSPGKGMSEAIVSVRPPSHPSQPPPFHLSEPTCPLEEPPLPFFR